MPPPSGGWKLHQVLGPGVGMLGEGGFTNLGFCGSPPLPQVSTKETCPPAAAGRRFHGSLSGPAPCGLPLGGAHSHRCSAGGRRRVRTAGWAGPGGKS